MSLIQDIRGGFRELRDKFNNLIRAVNPVIKMVGDDVYIFVNKSGTAYRIEFRPKPGRVPMPGAGEVYTGDGTWIANPIAGNVVTHIGPSYDAGMVPTGGSGPNAVDSISVDAHGHVIAYTRFAVTPASGLTTTETFTYQCEQRWVLQGTVDGGVVVYSSGAIDGLSIHQSGPFTYKLQYHTKTVTVTVVNGCITAWAEVDNGWTDTPLGP
jgi:hypothetical protein